MRGFESAILDERAWLIHNSCRQSLLEQRGDDLLDTLCSLVGERPEEVFGCVEGSPELILLLNAADGSQHLDHCL
jgi:hypothetical protein